MSDDFHSPLTFASGISLRTHFISLLRRLIYVVKNSEICHNDSPKSWGRVELNPMMTVWPRKIWPSFPAYLTRCQVSPASPTSINNSARISLSVYKSFTTFATFLRILPSPGTLFPPARVFWFRLRVLCCPYAQRSEDKTGEKAE